MNAAENSVRQFLAVEKPGRYTGGEVGSCPPNPNAELRVCVSFPDLYEIGMSNLAVKILYSRLNELKDISCERVFAAAPDLEKLLNDNDIPLCSLESSTPLHVFDILGFSIGYELLATNVLSILSLGRIPVKVHDRDASSPIVIAGGPGITNPFPFYDFFDAVLIGEAEGEIETVIEKCREIKHRGGDRNDLLSVFRARKHWWYPGKEAKTILHTWNGFGLSDNQHLVYYPVANIKTIQDHGVIEIMRGCINGCRFCHAGYFYRPCREKNLSTIIDEADFLVHSCGYREITLSSLSTGDYSKLWELLTCLNNKFAGQGVSFSLPSLRINSFSLETIQHLAAVRKSGLTFAVETANIITQKTLNKKIDTEHIVEIIRSAKQQGWKQAKFYFMIGLPGFSVNNEEDEIIAFVREIYSKTKMNLHVNIGTFVPKPHTPFQWEPQLNYTAALQKIYSIRDALKGRQFKIAYHYPLLSHIEGIIARGDSSVSRLLYDVFLKGARFDAWEEYFRKDIWEDALKQFKSRDEDNEFSKQPWESISLGISPQFLQAEAEKSKAALETQGCDDECIRPCGKCGESSLRSAESDITEEGCSGQAETSNSEIVKYMFSFTKKGKAMFLSHLNCMTIFERSFLRAGIDLLFSEGFNPKPKIEFAHPLMLGLESENEIAAVQCRHVNYGTEKLENRVNENLPEGIRILRAQTNTLRKSLMSNFAGAKYRIMCDNDTARKIKEKLGEYQQLYPDIIESIIPEENIDFVVRHQGKEGNLKTILMHLSGSEDFTPFIVEHPIVRLESYMVNAKDKLIPFMEINS